jgi:hypothetical protein
VLLCSCTRTRRDHEKCLALIAASPS